MEASYPLVVSDRYGNIINTQLNRPYIETRVAPLETRESQENHTTLRSSREQKKLVLEGGKESEMDRIKQLSFVCVLVATLAIMARATMEDDEKDCADQLTNLAACIPYVSGTAKMPTKECCDDTDKVRSAKPKCLCVLIKESTDPSLGLPINTSLALQMPTACKIDAKVSDCPSILNLPPDSRDAKIFKVATADSSTSTSTANLPPASASTSSAGSSTSPSSSSSATSSDSKKTTSANNGAKLGLNFLVMMGSAIIALILL